MNIRGLAFFLMVVLLQDGSATAQELDAFGLENMNAVKITTDQAAKNNIKTQKNTAEEKKPNKIESIKRNLEMLVKRGPATVPEANKNQSAETEELTEEERELEKIMNPEIQETPEDDSQQDATDETTTTTQGLINEAEAEAEEQDIENEEENKKTAKDERSLEYLMFNMNLSDEQLIEIQKLNEESSQKMALLMEKIKRLRQEVRDVESASLDNFETILNEEQKEKFKKLRLMYESNRSDINKLDQDIVSLGE